MVRRFWSTAESAAPTSLRSNPRRVRDAVHDGFAKDRDDRITRWIEAKWLFGEGTRAKNFAPGHDEFDAMFMQESTILDSEETPGAFK